MMGVAPVMVRVRCDDGKNGVRCSSIVLWYWRELYIAVLVSCRWWW